MHLSDFIDFSAVRTRVPASSKRALLQMLGQVAGQKLDLEPGAIVDSLLEREKLGSTGFGGGVAIPHGKVEGLGSVYGMVAQLEEPVDFEAVDKMPVDIVFMLLSPPDAGAEHLRALAAVSRVVRDAAAIDKMRGARSRDALVAVLMGADERTAA